MKFKHPQYPVPLPPQLMNSPLLGTISPYYTNSQKPHVPKPMKITITMASPITLPKQHTMPEPPHQSLKISIPTSPCHHPPHPPPYPYKNPIAPPSSPDIRVNKGPSPPPFVAQMAKKHIMSCQSCQGFLTDYLRIPPHPDHPFYSLVKLSVLKGKTAVLLSAEIYRHLMTITPLQKYAIGKAVKTRIQREEFKILSTYRFYLRPEEEKYIKELGWGILVEEISKIRGNSDIEIIKAIIQDSGMIRTDSDILRWIGYIFSECMDPLTNIHMEHKKEKEFSGGGAPLGLYSYN